MGGLAARHALPEDAQSSLRCSLRATFAADVEARLPRLRALNDVDSARRDAHTIASSAWVVGEPELSRLARAVEEQLEAGTDPVDLPALIAALESFAP